jgi:hypothetical protein
LSSGPNVGGVISQTVSVGVDRLGAAIPVNTLVWMALGVSFAVWISQLSLPPSRREIADR